jgi:DNA sulfur modification protein DndB
MTNIADHHFTFPAIRGIQAGREYYVSMCPLGLVHKIFKFDEEELSAELRAQRILNKTRVPEIARYITANPDNYVFSAITASIDGEVKFTTANNTPEMMRNGLLKIDMNSKIIVNDGQHRRAAIEMAIKEDISSLPESERNTTNELNRQKLEKDAWFEGEENLFEKWLEDRAKTRG